MTEDPRAPSAARGRALLARVAREPLVHLALLGGAIFAAHHLLTGARDDGPAPIVIDAALREALRARSEATGAADASEEALVEAFVREEALVREARALGLDRGDAIVRQRLVQKLELLVEATVDVPAPSEAELEEARLRDPRYRAPARVSFEHVFFARARADARGDAERALREVTERASREGEAAPSGGDPFLLGPSVAARPLASIASHFGPPFAEALVDAPVGRWSGPLESAYGQHLVRVTEASEARPLPMEEVRARVRADLLRARREVAVRRELARRVARHRVIHD